MSDNAQSTAYRATSSKLSRRKWTFSAKTASGWLLPRTWRSTCIANVSFRILQTFLSLKEIISAQCNPKCQNGGKCAGPNKCECPETFAGSHCQFSKEKCSPKAVGFNGSFQCMGSQTEMSCTLSCPAGIQFDSPPAASYKCKFAEGKFTPTKIPKCVYGEGMIVRHGVTESQATPAPDRLTRVQTPG